MLKLPYRSYHEIPVDAQGLRSSIVREVPATQFLLDELAGYNVTREFDALKSARPGRTLSKTEQDVLAKFESEQMSLKWGYALLFAEPVRHLTRPRHAAFIKLVRRGNIRINEVILNTGVYLLRWYHHPL